MQRIVVEPFADLHAMLRGQAGDSQHNGAIISHKLGFTSDLDMESCLRRRTNRFFNELFHSNGDRMQAVSAAIDQRLRRALTLIACLARPNFSDRAGRFDQACALQACSAALRAPFKSVDRRAVRRLDS